MLLPELKGAEPDVVVERFLHSLCSASIRGSRCEVFTSAVLKSSEECEACAS